MMVRDENSYAMRVPLGKEQWVNIVSNKPMTTDSFLRLGKYLALQEELVAEDEKDLAAPNAAHPMNNHEGVV
jgi:hypothetical protein